MLFSKQAFYDAVDNMKPEDVGLSSQLPFFRPTNVANGDSRVTCTTIYKCDNFSVRPACSCWLKKYSFCLLHELKIRLMNHYPKKEKNLNTSDFGVKHFGLLECFHFVFGKISVLLLAHNIFFLCAS